MSTQVHPSISKYTEDYKVSTNTSYHQNNNHNNNNNRSQSSRQRLAHLPYSEEIQSKKTPHSIDKYSRQDLNNSRSYLPYISPLTTTTTSSAMSQVKRGGSTHRDYTPRDQQQQQQQQYLLKSTKHYEAQMLQEERSILDKLEQIQKNISKNRSKKAQQHPSPPPSFSGKKQKDKLNPLRVLPLNFTDKSQSIKKNIQIDETLKRSVANTPNRMRHTPRNNSQSTTIHQNNHLEQQKLQDNNDNKKDNQNKIYLQDSNQNQTKVHVKNISVKGVVLQSRQIIFDMLESLQKIVTDHTVQKQTTTLL